jgi:CDP-glucose 4,6-dehydratase
VVVNGSYWQDRPVLVTGATGLLGGWLTRLLVENRANVVCLVRDWVPHCELLRTKLADSVNLVRGDVCDLAALARILGEYEIDTVFHLAAQTIVGTANSNPLSTFESNIKGTWNMLEACRHARVSAVVVASSDKAYGDQPVLPYTEDCPLQGRHPYDVSKSCADLIAQSYHATYGLPVAVTRCGNLYGGGDLNWNRLVPGTIRSVLKGERPVIRSDGRFERDYIYVEDAAAAYRLLAERLACDPEVRGLAFNFSCEDHLSVLELVSRILAGMRSSLEPDVRGGGDNEIRRQYLSAERARRMLGWAPAYSLQEGLRRTIHWYEEFLAN